MADRRERLLKVNFQPHFEKEHSFQEAVYTHWTLDVEMYRKSDHIFEKIDSRKEDEEKRKEI